MAKSNNDVKKVLNRVKTAQAQLERLLKDRTWVEDVRKYAEKQKGEVKRLLKADASKVKTFLERERKQLEKFQSEIPGELKKLGMLVQGQKKEFNQLLTRIRKNVVGKTAGKKSTKPRRKSTKAKTVAVNPPASTT